MKELRQYFKDYFPRSAIEEPKEEKVEVNSDNDVFEEDREKLDNSNDEAKLQGKVTTRTKPK